MVLFSQNMAPDPKGVIRLSLRSFQSPSPAPWPVQWPYKTTPPPRNTVSSEGPRLGFHAHKMPEIKAGLTTRRVLKSAQDRRGREIPRGLGPSLGIHHKAGCLGPRQEGSGQIQGAPVILAVI